MFRRKVLPRYISTEYEVKVSPARIGWRARIKCENWGFSISKTLWALTELGAVTRAENYIYRQELVPDPAKTKSYYARIGPSQFGRTIFLNEVKDAP